MNDNNLKEADYWVIYEDLMTKQESVKCNTLNTIFIGGEGSATGRYGEDFLKQFGHIITCQRNIQLPNTHYFHTANPWFVGKSYEELINMKEVPKTKKISVICSNVQLTEGHRQRYAFCMRLKEYFGEAIDLFGRGIRDFEDKWEVLADYQYSVVIENLVEENWFTEKLYDCFLAHTLPLYHGCPNITDYFSDKSFLKIDINDFNKTVGLIEHLLKDDNVYQQYLPYIITAKEKYLNNYNLYPLIVKFIEKNNLKVNTHKAKIKIESRISCSLPKTTIKSLIKNTLKQSPILGNIWNYRNLGLEYEVFKKEQKMQYENYLKSNEYIQAKRCEPWFAVNGDKTLRLNYDLSTESVVFDLGGYEGQWASDIFSKYVCNIYIFEPYQEYTNKIRERFANNAKIKVFDFGLSNANYSTQLYLSDDSSSLFREGQMGVEIQLRKALDFMMENHITQIDLIKINIEGGEYDLLEHLIESDFVSKVKNIQVQFHDFVIENTLERMKKIQQKLALTHQLTYQYEFVWENWQLLQK